MNKADVVQKVSERSGVDAETCERVIKAFEKVLQDELGSASLSGLLDKVGGVLDALRPKRD